jgi:hypothetical protein
MTTDRNTSCNEETEPRSRWRTPKCHGKCRAVVALLGVAAIAGTVFLTTVRPPPQPNTVDYELMRVSLQILGVVLVGFVVGMASFTLQQIRLDERKSDDRKFDERRRIDEQVRYFLADTVESYNGVKLIRRLLEAETTCESAPRITVDTYSRLLAQLCERQLVFESLMRRAPLIQQQVHGGEEIGIVLRKASGPGDAGLKEVRTLA